MLLHDLKHIHYAKSAETLAQSVKHTARKIRNPEIRAAFADEMQYIVKESTINELLK